MRAPRAIGLLLVPLALVLSASDQQSPQPPVPLAQGGLTGPPDFDAGAAGHPLCPRDRCPDKVQNHLATHGGIRGRLLATELGPARGRPSPGWEKPPALSPLPGASLLEARERLAAWLDARDSLAEPDLQDWKRVAVYRPRVSSGPYWDRLDWGPWPVTGAWSRTLEVAAGDLIEVQLSRLRPALGYRAPDPVAWLLQVEEGGDPARGHVVAWSDDHEGSASPSIRWVATAPGTLRLLIAAYQPGSAGFARLRVRVGGRPLWDEAGIFFGGVRIPQVEVAAGDILHAIAGRDGGDAVGTDASLFLLSEGFRSGAAWQAANNTLGLIPSLTVGAAATDATVLLSAFGRAPLDEPVLLLDRSGSGTIPDGDGDGLDEVLEGILGTCDGPSEEAACQSPVRHLRGWDSRDSDMDGPTDLEELVGVRRCYARVPVAPFWEPGRCRDEDGDGRCDPVCRRGDVVVEQPLGPVMGADPLRYDVWVEMDGRAVIEGEGDAYRICQPEGAALTQILDLYDPPYSAGRRRPPEGQGIAVHWFNDDVFPVGRKAHRPRLPSQAERRTWFNTMFTSARKYSGVFRYMVGTCGNAGQSDGHGRVGIVGVNDSPSGGTRVAHELGHLLALSHYWDRPNPDRTPFYLSLMNYGYMYRVPPMVPWDGDFARCGPSHAACGDGFTCAEAAKSWRCVPDCGRRTTKEALRPWGFSTGALGLPGAPRELDEIPEAGYPQWYLPWLYCYTDERHRISHTERYRRFHSPHCNLGRCVQCEGESCRIDWDRDGDFDGAEQFDVDYSATLDDVHLTDRSDFRRMLEEAWKGLRRMSYSDAILVADGFEPGIRTGITPGGPPAPEPDGGLWADVTNVCDEAGRWSKCRNRRGNHAALFRGPASGDTGLRYSSCQPRDSECAKRYRSTAGATLSLRVKGWTPTWEGEGATLAWLDGYRVEAVVSEDGKEVRWRVLGPGADGIIVDVRDRGAVGEWTRLVVHIDDRKDQVRLVVRRGDLVIDETASHAPMRDLDLSQLWIGAEPGEVTALTGLIDDVVLISWPVKY
jgi:hypothetical protein